MDKNGAAFLKRLLVTFKQEAGEHVREITTGLLALEQGQAPATRQGLMESVFRELHSLKGAARAVDRGEIERLCQAGEALLARLKNGTIEPSAAVLDLLHGVADLLGRLLATVEREPVAAERNAVTDLCRRLDAVAGGAEATADSSVPAAAPPSLVSEALTHAENGRHPFAEPPSTVRVQVSRLDAVLYRAEALLATKLALHSGLADLREARAVYARRERERAKRMAEVRALQRRLERGVQDRRSNRTAGAGIAQLRRLVDHIAGEDAFSKAFDARLGALASVTEKDVRSLGTQVDSLLEDLKQALMLPMNAVLEGLAKLVRDLSREQGKEVDFRADGGELELDRRILEELRDPLIHLVRNSLDHGVELPDVRVARGKPPRSHLSITASPLDGSRVEIRIADDGAGIDLARLRASAQKFGIAVPTGGDEAALLALAFESGVSTSSLITDLSGRGLGLAIVHDKVERLGGSVSVSSRADTGTTFSLILPLTLTTFRGVHVRAADEEYIFPSMGLERVVRLRSEDIVSIEGRETLRIDGQAVALARLADVLGLSAGEAPAAARGPAMGAALGAAVVSGAGERRIAYQVDEILGEQEVLVKPLGRQLRRVRNIAGATVLGSGRVVPILYPPDLLKSARRMTGTAARPAPAAPVQTPKSLLVAEDSITSRILLKGILESAGYGVATAVDGVDAWARLHSEPFDLLVSDVDMPRMDGFELTAKLRADRRLADLPVVLVTALDSRDDRQRGADAGASAYLVKSGFDQHNLLDIIRRLL